VSSHLYKSCADATAKIYKNHGVGGLFRGLSSTVARDTWGYVFYFAFYEYIKNMRYPIKKDGT